MTTLDLSWAGTAVLLAAANGLFDAAGVLLEDSQFADLPRAREMVERAKGLYRIGRDIRALTEERTHA